MNRMKHLSALFLVLLLSLSLTSPTFAKEKEAGTAPIAENLEITTYRGVSVGGTLSATDPDGGIITFEITTNPTKGSIELSDDGSFVYTPKEGKKGKDYFGFRAIDEDGNTSQEATVLITIRKQSGCVSYSDMDGNGAENAAVYLAENDIFVGEYVGGSYVFSPDSTVTRGEFLAMCMKVAEINLLEGVSSTGFSDDSEIPAWQKPYVSTALMNGMVSGYTDNEGNNTFCANTPVSYYEAAVIVNNVLGLSNVSVSTSEDTVVPTWAEQADANVNSCSILNGVHLETLDSLSRAEAALMVCNAVQVLENR